MRLRPVLLLCGLLSLNLFAASDSTQTKPNVAILQLEGNSIEKSDLDGLTNRLRIEIFKANKYTVLERTRMEEILKEQGFQQTGCTNTECAVQIGQLLNANIIILGSVDKIGNNLGRRFFIAL